MVKSGKLVKFDPDELKKIVRAARQKRVTANQYIRDACREKLQRDESQRQAVQE